MSGGTDIAVTVLAINDRFISRADCTLPYLEYALKWYVPCAKCANPWTALLKGVHFRYTDLCALYSHSIGHVYASHSNLLNQIPNS
jgi:hypothetical protein